MLFAVRHAGNWVPFWSGQSAKQQAAINKSAASDELFDTIARLDAAIFDAFNRHDLDRLMSMFTGDLQFYHDTGGLTDHEQTRENPKKLFADNPDVQKRSRARHA